MCTAVHACGNRCLGIQLTGSPAALNSAVLQNDPPNTDSMLSSPHLSCMQVRQLVDKSTSEATSRIATEIADLKLQVCLRGGS